MRSGISFLSSINLMFKVRGNYSKCWKFDEKIQIMPKGNFKNRWGFDVKLQAKPYSNFNY